MRKIDKYIFLISLPAIAYILIFTIYPIVSNFILSLYTQDPLGRLIYTGLENYFWFKKDPYLSRIIVNTLLYMFATPIIDIIFAIPLAVALKRVGSKWLFLIMLPAFIPPVTAASMWYLMINPFFGVAYYLTKTNLASSIWTVVLIDVWRSLPMATLIIYSGLVSIPKEIQHAASSDGLAGAKRFFMIDLPLISPQILTAFVLMMITGLFTFDPIYIGTSQAGPRILDNLAYYAFDQFYSGVPGYAAAIIVLMSLLSTALAIIYIKTLGSQKFMRLSVPDFIPNSEAPLWLHKLIVAIYLAFFLIPMYWIINIALKTPIELISIPPLLYPRSVTFANFDLMFTQGLPYIITTLAVASINTLITLFLVSPLAYSMASHKFGGSKLLIYILYLNATPTLIYIIPIFAFLKILGIINTWWALILTYPIMTIPITTWIMYNYYLKFPKQIEEAAQMDGMNRLKVFYKMVLPLSRSGLSVAAIYAFLYSWGALIFPLAFTYSPYDLSKPLSFSGAQTFSIFIGLLMSPVSMSYGGVAAAGVISSIPSLVLLYFGRNNLEKIWGTSGGKI
ncbi:ABC transporter permease subunit [Fervidicoccus fontis]|uniref:ABC transporter permease subunit n=1 Tax=Fervidicoccus fontis TaxID=683846 RepID=A0A843A6H0_9CREN|nr:ABC transporter permease subunit [Fervidicoccus fontis]MBE9390898.1 ABC transporter permease subunit [Fervidicoccus fontis]